MLDPLKRLLSMIQAQHYNKDSDSEIDKLIFMGDYIDFGPCSKEVIDYITALPFEKIFMMGNHDDLLLQFIDHSDLMQSFGNVWFRGNGGQRTVSSFFPHLFYRDNQESISREDFPLDDVYVDFFRNLKISHVERMGDHKLAFVHALLNKEFPVEEQLSLKTYDDFHAWRKENKIWIENTILWNREEPKKRFDDYILVHGHIPTPNLHLTWKNLHGYNTELEMPFLKFEAENEDDISFYDDSYINGYTGSPEQLISINTDTGAVYGNRLTAIGVSEDLFNEAEILVFQVSVGKGYRLAEDFRGFKIRFPGF
ncbi:MAG: hypothetical protein GY859_21335 [Desulfobacterales bacterium]|nr:hypothetical protein [Desulfobacterales bacterium]